MTLPKRSPIDTEETPIEERIQKALKHYRRCLGTKEEISIRKAAKLYGIKNWERLRGRLHGAKPRENHSAEMQRLSPMEESVLVAWCLQLYNWGWPARITQLRRMAVELLKEKGDTLDLGSRWQDAFLGRHPELKSKFVRPRDRKRYLAQSRDNFLHWFNMYHQQKVQHQVHDDDTWNLDEKGVMVGVAGKVRVILSKYEKNPYSTHPGNREWVTSTECCSLTGRKLGSWTIFKAKTQQKKWFQTMERLEEQNYTISTSESGWTDNELGLAYLEEHFEPQTRETKGEQGFRILIVDGHESHITTQAIRFCVNHKIILLCLPPHTTHLLQPLDVGVFSPLAVAYKNGILEQYSFTSSIVLDKVDFLEIWHAARKRAMTSETIQSAWRKAGILPNDPRMIDPTVVLSQLPQEPSIDKDAVPSRPATANRAIPPVSDWKTPKTIPELEKMLEGIQDGKITHEGQLQLIQKIGKAASDAMVTLRATQSINTQLMGKAKEKGIRNREGGDYGKARVMGQAELYRREQYGLDMAFQRAATPFFTPLSLDIFTVDIYTKATRPLSPKKQNQLFQRSVKPILCHLTPDIFAPRPSNTTVLSVQEEPVKISRAGKALETVKKTAERHRKKTQQRAIQKPQMEALIVQTRSGRTCTQIRTVRD
jgi:DDE superfamily endonuclease/Tc5 transposase DNA-binding domain/helix-turn-helix, Psq domain